VEYLITHLSSDHLSMKVRILDLPEPNWRRSHIVEKKIRSYADRVFRPPTPGKRDLGASSVLTVIGTTGPHDCIAIWLQAV
jgi:hypothetical protein